MATRSVHPFVRASVLGLLLVLTTGCIESVRVPLAVPLPTIGGSRPAGPQGIQLVGEFGDGVWGQEQERAEMVGGALGFSARDRVEFSTSSYFATRTVSDSDGNAHSGEATVGVRGKVRLHDFHDGRASVGIHLAVMNARRERAEQQNERLSALDIAIPVEFYPIGGPLVDYRFGVFAAPRVVFQSFEELDAHETTTGAMVSAVAGLVGRWRYFAITGELNLARTPTMTFGDTTFGAGVHVLPMLGLRGIIPVGD